MRAEDLAIDRLDWVAADADPFLDRISAAALGRIVEAPPECKATDKDALESAAVGDVIGREKAARKALKESAARARLAAELEREPPELRRLTVASYVVTAHLLLPLPLCALRVDMVVDIADLASGGAAPPPRFVVATRAGTRMLGREGPRGGLPDAVRLCNDPAFQLHDDLRAVGLESATRMLHGAGLSAAAAPCTAGRVSWRRFRPRADSMLSRAMAGWLRDWKEVRWQLHKQGLEVTWQEKLAALRAHVAAHGRLPPQGAASGLSMWIANQRQAKKAMDAGVKSSHKMTPERAAALEGVPGWSWGRGRGAAAPDAPPAKRAKKRTSESVRLEKEKEKNEI